ncbi:MAG: carboxypeptidase-like regulatory domain-containing protein, partial [Alistipes sp.]|nr:carboxypeptidase-like regulatory domain-containing protein [Alistipes sp.]
MKLKEYIKGKRTGSDARRIELEAMQDAFLEEALEGYDRSGGDHAGALDRLSARLQERTHRAVKTPPVPLWRRTAFIRSIAAVVALLLVSTVVYRYSLSPELNPVDVAVGERAEYMEEEIPAIGEAVSGEEEVTAVEAPQPPVILTVPDVINIVSDMVMIEDAQQLIEYDIYFDDIGYDEAAMADSPASPRSGSASPRSSSPRAYQPSAASSGDLIHGTVTDYQGQPLIGATVVVQGTTTGALTDVDGMFLIRAEAGDILEVRDLGYVTEVVAVTGPGMRITLAEDISRIDEVVVTALGVQRRSNRTGSISAKESDPTQSRRADRQSIH